MTIADVKNRKTELIFFVPFIIYSDVYLSFSIPIFYALPPHGALNGRERCHMTSTSYQVTRIWAEVAVLWRYESADYKKNGRSMYPQAHTSTGNQPPSFTVGVKERKFRLKLTSTTNQDCMFTKRP